MSAPRTPYDSGLCCMAAHAAAQINHVPSWTCPCPCHTQVKQDAPTPIVSQAARRGQLVREAVEAIHAELYASGVMNEPMWYVGPKIATAIVDTIFGGSAVDLPSWPYPARGAR